jgi:hypothetical protein
MRRIFALAIAFVALIAAGFLWTRDQPTAIATEAPPGAVASDDPDGDDALVAPTAAITPEQREARRFSRYDRDNDSAISRDEYLTSRQKAFAKLDSNGDGRLAFDEYAAATTRKFSKADRDADGRLAPGEFATTAPKRRSKPVCDCASGDTPS